MHKPPLLALPNAKEPISFLINLSLYESQAMIHMILVVCASQLMTKGDVWMQTVNLICSPSDPFSLQYLFQFRTMASDLQMPILILLQTCLVFPW